jgi:hypothetical protein
VTAPEGSTTTDVPVEMVLAKEKPKLPPPPPPKPAGKSWSPWLTAGLVTTGVGLGTGIGAGVAALKGCAKYGYPKPKSCPAAIVSDVGFGVALAGVAIGAVGVVFTLKSGEPAAPKSAALASGSPEISSSPSRSPAGASIRLEIGPGFTGLSGEL